MEKHALDTSREVGSGAVYPRTYRVSGGWRVFFYVVAGVSLAGGLASLYWAAAGAHAAVARILLAAFGIGFIALGAYTVLWFSKAAIVLYPDTIELHDISRVRTLHRHELSGWRGYDNTTPAQLVLETHDLRKIKVARVFKTDATFDIWFAHLRNLDVHDAREFQRKVQNDPALGGTLPERMRQLRTATWAARTVNIVAGAGALAGWFYPRPYGFIVGLLILLPWIGLGVAARFRGLVRVDAKKNDPHPTVGIAFLIPGFVLMLRVVTDIHVMNWRPVLWMAVVIALVMTFAAVRVDPLLAKNRWMALLLLGLTMPYGYGAGIEADALLDRAAPTVYRTTLLDKHISRGSKHTDYELTVGPWGPYQTNQRIDVAPRIYYSLKRGDDVCVQVRPGALRIAWYVVGRCE
jgi:hypothetical protein